MKEETVEFVDGIKIIHVIENEFDQSTLELQQQRLSICNSCDKRTNDSCSECACLLSVRTSYNDSFCPIGKW